MGGRRGLLGLTRERQSQLGGAGFAGMGAGAYGEGREDLMRDIAMKQRGSRADYQKGIAGQVAEDIRAGVDIKSEEDNPNYVPFDNPNWSPPDGTSNGQIYNFDGKNYYWSDDDANWVSVFRWSQLNSGEGGDGDDQVYPGSP